MPLDWSVAADQLTRIASPVGTPLPSVSTPDPTLGATCGAWAVGRSFTTVTDRSASRSGPSCVPVTRNVYVPAVRPGRHRHAELGRLSRSSPSGSLAESDAVHPAGTFDDGEVDALEERRAAGQRDRHRAVPPASPTGATRCSAPRIRTTRACRSGARRAAARGSRSGSVEVFQRRLPRYRRFARPRPGSRVGRLALYRATAPVTVGRRHARARHVAVVGPGLVDQMHLPGAMRSTSRAVVAEVGERVVLVVAAPRIAAVAAEPAGLAVRVGQRRDRDDLVVRGRHPWPRR